MNLIMFIATVFHALIVFHIGTETCDLKALFEMVSCQRKKATSTPIVLSGLYSYVWVKDISVTLFAQYNNLLIKH